MYEPLSDRAKKLVKWSLISVTVALVVVTTLAVGLVGKNITYTARLTPPAQRAQLDEASVYYYSQISLLALGLLFNLALLANGYVAFTMNRRKFRINIGTAMSNLGILVLLWLGTMVVTIAFVVGGGSYQSLLKAEMASPSTWDNCAASLCGAATCARLSAYSAAHSMSVAFAVIGSLLGTALVPLSLLINSNRIEQLQLLEK